MNNPLPRLFVLALLVLAGCSSTPTQVNTATIHASTFSFINPGPRNVLGIADPHESVHKIIQDAIAKNLGSKGVRHLAAGGDVTVAYLVIVGDNATTESISTYFGYDRDDTELEKKAHSAYNNTKNPNYFQAGTLLIDIIDSKTNKLLKRAYTVRRLLRNPTVETRTELIQEAVDEILKDASFAGK